MDEYNSLSDKHLINYFHSPHTRKQLQRNAIILSNGELLTEESNRLMSSRLEQRDYRLLLDAVNQKNGCMPQQKQKAKLINMLENMMKKENVKRIREETSKNFCLGERLPLLPLRKEVDHASKRQHLVIFNSKYNHGAEQQSHMPSSIVKITKKCGGHLVDDQEEDDDDDQDDGDYDDDEESFSSDGCSCSSGNTSVHDTNTRTRKKVPKKREKRSKDLTPSACRVTMHYFGRALNLDMKGTTRDEVTVVQQHCGGNNVVVFKEEISPRSVFVITSRRKHGFPFSLTFHIGGQQDCRLSACCEFKHSTGMRLGGRKGHFGVVSIDGGEPCRNCQIIKSIQSENQKKPKKLNAEECSQDKEPTIQNKNSREPVIQSRVGSSREPAEQNAAKPKNKEPHRQNSLQGSKKPLRQNSLQDSKEPVRQNSLQDSKEPVRKNSFQYSKEPVRQRKVDNSGELAVHHNIENRASAVKKTSSKRRESAEQKTDTKGRESGDQKTGVQCKEPVGQDTYKIEASKNERADKMPIEDELYEDDFENDEIVGTNGKMRELRHEGAAGDVSHNNEPQYSSVAKIRKEKRVRKSDQQTMGSDESDVDLYKDHGRVSKISTQSAALVENGQSVEQDGLLSEHISEKPPEEQNGDSETGRHSSTLVPVIRIFTVDGTEENEIEDTSTMDDSSDRQNSSLDERVRAKPSTGSATKESVPASTPNDSIPDRDKYVIRAEIHDGFSKFDVRDQNEVASVSIHSANRSNSSDTTSSSDSSSSSDSDGDRF